VALRELGDDEGSIRRVPARRESEGLRSLVHRVEDVLSAFRLAAALTLACLATGEACSIQALDPAATSGGPVATNGGTPATSTVCPAGCPAEQFCIAGTCVSVDTTTPAIELADAGTTTDPCVAMKRQSLDIRQRSCASCHAPPAKMGGFGVVLDDDRLLTTSSSSATDDAGKPVPLVVPGNPEGSRLYQRIRRGEMPPTQTPPLRAPTISDLSILHTWITSCLGPIATATDGG
jgi:hypothetical protein